MTQPRRIDWKRVGRKLRGARRNGLRPTAESVGISYHTLWRLERGQSNDIEAFLRVCGGLQLDPFVITGLRP